MCHGNQSQIHVVKKLPFPFSYFPIFRVVMLGFKFRPKNSGAEALPLPLDTTGYHPGGASSPSTTAMAAPRRRSIARPSCIRCVGSIDGRWVGSLGFFVFFFTPFGKKCMFFVDINTHDTFPFRSLKVGDIVFLNVFVLFNATMFGGSTLSSSLASWWMAEPYLLTCMFFELIEDLNIPMLRCWRSEISLLTKHVDVEQR